jgi:hypothetical protein
MPSLRSALIVLAVGAFGAGCGGGDDNGAQPGDDGGADSTSDSTLPDGSNQGGDGGGGDSTTDGGPRPDAAPDSMPSIDAGASVLQFHLNPSRDGHFIDPAMTKVAAAALKVDTTFGGINNPGVRLCADAACSKTGGPLWATPLYVENGVGGKGTFYVADDSNNLYAIDETTGAYDWAKLPFAQRAGATGTCGNVAPIGVTGTPIIDLPSRTMFFVAAEGTGSAISSQKIHAVSIDTGDEVTTPAGWPVDVSKVKAGSLTFSPKPQNQRAALSLLNGYLYAPFGGEDGDCCNGSDSCSMSGNGTYYGWIVSVPVAAPTSATAFATAAPGGGIWGVGGMASDGTDVFAVTSNGYANNSAPWSQSLSEAVLRFHGGIAFDPAKTTDFFTPSNWQNLDGSDTDLGGTGSLVVNVPGATPSTLVVALGKSGVMHLLDHANLGGIGTGNGTTHEGLYSDTVSAGQMRTAAASYTTSLGTYVVFNGGGGSGSCPLLGKSGDLIAVRIAAASPPTFKVAWCANSNGGGIGGSPIATTTDAAGSNAIVWAVGADGNNQLTGWDGDTGANIFNGGGFAMDNVIHYTSLINVKGRLIVGSNDKIYAFTTK